MKTISISGSLRQSVGKRDAKELRYEGKVPCVLYGGSEQVHFAVPMILFRELLYSADVYEVELNIEGTKYRAILQDSQFHPVNEMIYHVDFLEIQKGKPIKIAVPIKVTGNSPGVIKGGKMVQKLRKVTLRGQAENIPDFVTVDISGLDLGQTVKVNKLQVEGCEILNPMSNPVATIDIPRALRGKLTA